MRERENVSFFLLTPAGIVVGRWKRGIFKIWIKATNWQWKSQKKKSETTERLNISPDSMQHTHTTVKTKDDWNKHRPCYPQQQRLPLITFSHPLRQPVSSALFPCIRLLFIFLTVINLRLLPFSSSFSISFSLTHSLTRFLVKDILLAPALHHQAVTSIFFSFFGNKAWQV